MHEFHAIAQNALNVFQVACIGQRIQHGDMHIGMIAVHVVHEVRTDEATATGDNDVLRGE